MKFSLNVVKFREYVVYFVRNVVMFVCGESFFGGPGRFGFN